MVGFHLKITLYLVKIIRVEYECVPPLKKFIKDFWEQVKFLEDSLKKTGINMVCFSRPYHLKFFKDLLPLVLLRSILNTLPHVFEDLLQEIKQRNHVEINFSKAG